MAQESDDNTIGKRAAHFRLRPRLTILVVVFACIGAVLILLSLAEAVSGKTEVIVVARNGELYAEINGRTTDVPADKLDPVRLNEFVLPLLSDGSGNLRSGAVEDSPGWQPTMQNAFSFLGVAGGWFQHLQPAARWDDAKVGGDGVARYILSNGRGRAWLQLVSGESGEGYALAVQPESRNMAWWRLERGVPVELLDSISYRPQGKSTVADLTSDFVITLAAGGILLVLALISALILSWRKAGEGREGTNTAVRPIAKAQGEQRGLLGRLRDIASRRYMPALALFFAGTVLSSVICLSVLDGIPHVQDEVAYIFQGKIFAEGRWWVPAPEASAQEFFNHEFIQMSEGRWFGKYPPGYPLLLAPGLWAGLPWLINALGAGVSLALVYMSGRLMFNRRVGAWAALMGLISPWVLLMSGSYMSHPTGMMWSALFLFSLVRMHSPFERDAGIPTDAQGGRHKIRGSDLIKWPLMGGGAIGMLFITRQLTAVGIGLGAAVWALGLLALDRGRRMERLLQLVMIVVGFVPFLFLMLYDNRQLTGDWLDFPQNVDSQLGFGPGIGSPQGHTPAMGAFNVLLFWRTLVPLFNGWPAPLAMAPIALGLFAWVMDGSKRWVKWDVLLWLCWSCLVASYVFWWSSTTIYGPRYWYEGMPFLLLIAGRGVDVLGKVAHRCALAVVPNGRALASRLTWVVPGLIAGMLSMYNLTQTEPHQFGLYRGYNDITPSALRKAEAAHLSNALVFVQLRPPPHSLRDYGKVFFANDPLLRGNIVYARDLGREANLSLLPMFSGRQPYWLPLDGPPVPGVGDTDGP
jgi:hypothetical protein